MLLGQCQATILLTNPEIINNNNKLLRIVGRDRHCPRIRGSRLARNGKSS